MIDQLTVYVHYNLLNQRSVFIIYTLGYRICHPREWFIILVKHNVLNLVSIIIILVLKACPSPVQIR